MPESLLGERQLINEKISQSIGVDYSKSVKASFNMENGAVDEEDEVSDVEPDSLIAELAEGDGQIDAQEEDETVRDENHQQDPDDTDEEEILLDGNMVQVAGKKPGVSYFVDFGDVERDRRLSETSSVTPNHTNYQRSVSRESQNSAAISFFVDFSRNSNREDEKEAAANKRAKNFLRKGTGQKRRLDSANLRTCCADSTNAYFKKVKEIVKKANSPGDTLEDRLTRIDAVAALIHEEETRLRAGSELSDPETLEPEYRRRINKTEKSSENAGGGGGGLRRERTFDMDPRTKRKASKDGGDMKLVDIDVNAEQEKNNNGAGGSQVAANRPPLSGEQLMALDMFVQLKKSHIDEIESIRRKFKEEQRVHCWQGQELESKESPRNDAISGGCKPKIMSSSSSEREKAKKPAKKKIPVASVMMSKPKVETLLTGSISPRATKAEADEHAKKEAEAPLPLESTNVVEEKQETPVKEDEESKPEPPPPPVQRPRPVPRPRTRIPAAIKKDDDSKPSCAKDISSANSIMTQSCHGDLGRNAVNEASLLATSATFAQPLQTKREKFQLHVVEDGDVDTEEANRQKILEAAADELLKGLPPQNALILKALITSKQCCDHRQHPHDSKADHPDPRSTTPDNISLLKSYQERKQIQQMTRSVRYPSPREQVFVRNNSDLERSFSYQPPQQKQHEGVDFRYGTPDLGKRDQKMRKNLQYPPRDTSEARKRTDSMTSTEASIEVNSDLERSFSYQPPQQQQHEADNFRYGTPDLGKRDKKMRKNLQYPPRDTSEARKRTDSMTSTEASIEVNSPRNRLPSEAYYVAYEEEDAEDEASRSEYSEEVFSRPESSRSLRSAKILDLESSLHEANLQAALERKRPDYIAKTRLRSEKLSKKAESELARKEMERKRRQRSKNREEMAEKLYNSTKTSSKEERRSLEDEKDKDETKENDLVSSNAGVKSKIPKQANSRTKKEAAKKYESPYGQSQLAKSAMAKKMAGVSKIMHGKVEAQKNNDKEVFKNKESGVYKTNRTMTMSTIASRNKKRTSTANQSSSNHQPQSQSSKYY